MAAQQKRMQESEKTEQQRNKTTQESLRIETEKERLAQQRIRTAEQQAKADERAARAVERERTALKNTAPAYKELSDKARALKNESKELAAQMLKLEAEGRRNTAEFKRLSKAYDEVTAKARTADAQLKHIDSTVGDNFRNVGNYRTALGGLESALGTLGIAFGIGTVVQGAGRTIMEFDQAVADLISITGASGDDLNYLKEQSIALGKEVSGGASAVIEGYKLIGSARPELLSNAEALNSVTESAIKLSQASGMTLPDAATALTDAMNQFGAPAEKAGEFINVLANGALFGAAEIPQVTEAMLKFGAVAKSSNVSVQESTALIEALASKGLKGAEAGTALRNVMLTLSAPETLPTKAREALEGLGISFEDLSDKSKPFAERLDALKPALQDQAAMLEVFGKENVVAATNLVNMSDSVKQLTTDMDTQGTISKQAEDRTKTLSHAFTQLKGAWDEFVLGLTSGEGASKVMLGTIQFLAENLGTIISVLGKVVVAWGAYKAVQLSLMAIEKARAFSFKEFGQQMLAQIPLTKQYAAAQKTASAATKDAGEAAETAGRGMAAVPWVAIAAVVIELAMAFYDMASGAARAREQAERLNNYKTRASDDSLKNITKETTELDKQLKQRDRDLELALAKAKTDKERNQIELEFAKLRQNDIKQTKSQITSYRNSAAERLRGYRNEKKELESLYDIRFGNRTDRQQERIDQLERELGVSAWGSAAERSRDAFDILDAKIQAAGTRVTEYNNALKVVDESLKDAEGQTELNTLALNDNNDSIGGNINLTKTKISSQKELNTEMAQYNEYLTRQNELLDDLDQQRATQQIETLTSEISDLLDEANMLAEGGIVPDLTVVNQKLQEKFNLESKFIQDKLKAEIRAINERYDAESKKEKEKITENFNKLIGQDGLTPQERDKINAQYKAQMEQFDMDELQRAADKELEIKLITESADYEQINLEKAYGDEQVKIKNDVNDRLVESITKGKEEEKDKTEEGNEKIEDVTKAHVDRMKALADLLTDYLVAQSDKRIARIEKEMAAAEQQRDFLQTLAEEGNIQATQSLAEQNRIIAEANMKKEQEERRKQKIELANSVFQTYSSKVESGSQNPLTDTIRDISLLNQFISTFTPTFKDGTEDTGHIGAGVDGQGGFHAILHPHERVLTKEQNKMVGDLSNIELASLAASYQAGSMINREGALQIGNGWNTQAVIKQLESLERTIKNKPEHNLEVENVVQGAMDIVRSSKAGGTTIYNRYRVKK
jgi:TP901 family phage tail tape measure protein